MTQYSLLLADKLTHKRRTGSEIRRTAREFRFSKTDYADDKFRKNAASGGAVTSLLAGLLCNRSIDGVVICQQTISDGSARAWSVLAKRPENRLEQKSAQQQSDYLNSLFEDSD